MIKMIIGGEEVVSNKEFTINEEMLSASSTILNNCYPKSWEDNKDYTSNFYYPKDYSKFLLGEGEFLHGISEYSVLTESGSNPFYETNVEKEWNSLNVYGNTYQDTRSGKNLANPSTMTLGNITYDSSTGIYSASDNDDASTLIMKLQQWSSLSNYINGTQIIKTITSTGRISFTSTIVSNAQYIRIGNNGKSYEFRILIPVPSSFTVGTQFTVSYDIIDTTIGAVKLQNIQLEKGATATSYEPYGEMPSPEYPSELVSVGYENLFNWRNPREITLIKSTSRTTVEYNNTSLVLEPGIYTLSFPNLQMSNNNYNLGVELVGVIGGGTLTNNYRTFTISETKTLQYLYIYLNNSDNANATAMFSQILLTKDSQPHSYIPYGKYGIEVKNTGKNLLEPNFQSATSVGATITYTDNGWLVNGTLTSASTNFDIFNKELPPGTYTINGIIGSANNTFQVVIYKNNTIYAYLTNLNRTFTINETTLVRLRLYLYRNYGTFDNLLLPYQLEKGTQATTYEEYKSNSQLYILDEPLRKVGNYQDRLYVSDGILYVERKIGKIVLNGSENYSNQGGTYDTETRMMFSVRVNSIPIDMTNRKGLCNYFKNYSSSVQSASVDVTAFNFNNQPQYSNFLYFKIEKSLLPTQNEIGFANWVSNHNIEVIYQMETPTTTPIGYVNIPNAYEGQNTTYLYTGLETTIDVLYYWKNFNVLFAGVVKNTGDISLNPRYPHYCNLQILDYKTFLSESNTLDFVIANKTVKEAIGMVVNAISGYGFILGEVNIDSADDIIGAYSTLNKTAYDVLQYLANISGSRWRARYVDSSTMAIDFYDPDTLPQGADIEYTQEYWENNNIVDLTFNYGTRDYRNKQILLSDEVYANINYNETLISNGYTNTFTLQNNIGTVVNILVGNEEKTVATTNDKQMGIDADFYYAPGKNILESNSVYSAGTLIKITYQPLVKGRQIVYNTNEVDRISTQTDTEGVIARYENRNDILSSDELEKIAQTYIEYKGKAEVILTLTTRNNDLYNIGEVVYFDAPIPDLAQNYMVKTKKTEYIVIDEIVNLFYIYEMTSSFNSEKAINYFDNQRNKASGNIAEGDSITRNIDIETDVAIIWTGGTVSSASITVDGDNVLNSVLNSPFVE